MLKIKVTFLTTLFLTSCYLFSAEEKSNDTCTCEKIVSLVQQGCIGEAIDLLESYKISKGEDCLFEILLTYIAESIDQNAICQIVDSEKGKKWAQLFLDLANKKVKDSVTLQAKSELIARKLVLQDRCNKDFFSLFANAAKTFEVVPVVDFITLRRAYGNIFSLDPYDESLFADMAHAAYRANWIDYAWILYRRYFNSCRGNADQILEYSRVVERQYNITFSLNLNEIYGRCVEYNYLYWQRRAEILNTGSLGEESYYILLELLKQDPNSYINWAVFSQAAATINHRQEALYALEQAEWLKPSAVDTDWAEWLSLPPVMSKVTFGATYYHESTTLSNVTEEGNYYKKVDCDTKYILGFEAFQTKARPKIILVGGIFRLVGPDNQETAEVESGWVGIDKLLNPKLLATLRVGAGRSNIAGANDRWTPAYYLDLDSRWSDFLNLHFFSTYNFYQISPRASFFKIKRFRNVLTIDWKPDYDTQFLTILDGRILTDGNKQLEVYFYPRRHFVYLEHWKLSLGLMGNWLTSRTDPIHGYYAPKLYQVYAGQAIAEYRANLHSTIRGAILGGTQKDNFSTFFGPFAQVTLDCNLEFSLYWRLRLIGDYYYINQSGGSFNYIKYFGELTYRF